MPPIRTNATSRIKTAVERSFAIRAPKLFNCLPKTIRSSNLSYDTFKMRLDELLNKVDDNPSVQGLRPRAVSNSLVDQLELMKRDGTYSLL